MNDHPVADLRAARDLQASRAACRQYERAARMHEAAANDLMLRGWFTYAGEAFILSDRLTLAAKKERLP